MKANVYFEESGLVTLVTACEVKTFDKVSALVSYCRDNGIEAIIGETIK
jgi:hypothetical protein